MNKKENKVINLYIEECSARNLANCMKNIYGKIHTFEHIGRQGIFTLIKDSKNNDIMTYKGDGYTLEYTTRKEIDINEESVSTMHHHLKIYSPSFSIELYFNSYKVFRPFHNDGALPYRSFFYINSNYIGEIARQKSRDDGIDFKGFEMSKTKPVLLSELEDKLSAIFAKVQKDLSQSNSELARQLLVTTNSIADTLTLS